MRDSELPEQGDPEGAAGPETTSAAGREAAGSPRAGASSTRSGSRAEAGRAQPSREAGLRGAILALVDAVEALAAEPERDGDGARRRIDEARRLLGEQPGGDDRRESAPRGPAPTNSPAPASAPSGKGPGGGSPAEAPGTERTHQDLQRALE